MFKQVDGERFEVSAKEEAEIRAEWVRLALPPTQAKIDARLDAEVDRLDSGDKIIRALAQRIFMLERAANPSLTPEQFKAQIRESIASVVSEK